MEKLTVIVKQLPANDSRCFREVEDENKILDTADYVGVYKTTFDVIEDTEKQELTICEHLFNTLNIKHPENYAGRSMSVGDIVIIRNNDFHKESCFVCQSLGFKQVRFC